MRHGSNERVPGTAAQALLDRGWGKPKVEVVADGGGSCIEALRLFNEQIRLDDNLHRLAGELSHCQKQWLEIGMLLAQDPKLLLVDEPAAGMTAPEREVTVTLLRDLARTRSVVVVEHDMEFIRALDCRVTVMHEGSVLAEGLMDFVTGNQKVIDVYLGR
jgi:urea transport system ATP-binding protein